MEFNWLYVLIGFAAAGIIFNASRIFGAYLKKKRAEKNLRKIEREIDRIKAELKRKSNALAKSLEKDLKEVGK